MQSVAIALFLVGLVMILVNPLFGFVPGVFLIVMAIVLGVIGYLLKGLGVAMDFGSRKHCPECMSEIPSAAVVCRYCGYRYDTGAHA